MALLEGTGGTADIGPDPVALMKAVKNTAEIAGSRAAHARDGAAMTRFLHWLSEEAPKGRLTEIDAAVKLEAFRAETGVLKDVSFPSISGAGPNAALPHYRVTSAPTAPIEPGHLPHQFRRASTRTARPTSPAPSRWASPTPR